MPSNIDLLQFLSSNPIDKIVQSGEITIVNDGDTTSGGTNTGPQTAKVVEDTVTNGYGRAGLVRARWSIDGGSNWQGMESLLTYTFTITLTDIPVTSSPIPQLRAAISIGCSDSTVTFRTANGDHGNQSKTSAQGHVGYTPVSRTFVIQYELYERE